ncbi:hypothetical protein BGX34_006367, partial [Mortierella sp. NVP85]
HFIIERPRTSRPRREENGQCPGRKWTAEVFATTARSEGATKAVPTRQDIVNKYLELAGRMLEDDVQDNQNVGIEFILKAWKGGEDLRVVMHCNTG